MTTINKTYDFPSCANTGDIDEPLKGYAFRKVADECWCGNRKHIEWSICSTCQILIQKDASK